MCDESNPTTLYVGNLDHSVSEELLCTLFAQIGQVNGCKVIREPGNDPYAFIDFMNHQNAATALVAMNKRLFLDKEMKVNWATSSGNQPKLDTSNHYHIFVGDLSPEIETQTLREAFAPFGEISNCRIVRDPQTLKSKGYAFISFVKKAEAENAIIAMNGQWLGSRSIRTNWSTRKPPPPRDNRNTETKAPTYEEVYNQSSPTNCTVYCGGFINGIDDDLIHRVFSPFGTIQDIRCFKDKGYAFIKFTTKDSAAHAIEGVHNMEINGNIVKCFWGKENVDTSSTTSAVNTMAPTATPQWNYVYGNMSGGAYWYPQAYPAAPTQMQQYNSMGMTSYPYAQYAYQQHYRMASPMPAASWSTVPAQGMLQGNQQSPNMQPPKMDSNSDQSAGELSDLSNEGMKVILLSCLLFGLAYSADLTCKCGLKSPINMVGLKTKRIDYPWMVALFRTSDNVAYCGGTIVTTRHVVTAAHCVNVPKTDIYLVTGAYDLNNEMENTRQSLPVDRIIVHNDRTSDIALLLTEIEIAYNQLVGPVCMAQGLAVDNLSNQIVKAMGWGRYDPNRPSMDKIKKFREVDLEVMSPNSCSGVNETRMCTYKAGKSSCNRDSGGPIVWKDPEARRYILVGVVSSGPDNCGDSSAPGVNINVLHYQGWINDMIGETSNAKACFVV